MADPAPVADFSIGGMSTGSGTLRGRFGFHTPPAPEMDVGSPSPPTQKRC